MFNWIWKQPLSSENENVYYTVQRLNNNFIKEHNYLVNNEYVIEKNTSKILPNNIWKNKIELSKSDYDGNIIQMTKTPNNMLAEDYQHLDVWKKQEVYADFDFNKYRSFRDKYGYVNSYKKMPFHFDRDPESFGLVHRNPERASLTDTPRAYDNDEYYRAKGLLRK